MANPVAIFNYNLWVTRYPELEGVSPELAQLYFDEATLYLRNDGSGPVTDEGTQLRLLNMVTAHIAAINHGVSGGIPSPLVGQITGASEGSVSVSANALQAPGTYAWFVLTRYGAEFWAATAAYRRMHYRAPVPRAFGPWPRRVF